MEIFAGPNSARVGASPLSCHLMMFSLPAVKVLEATGAVTYKTEALATVSRIFGREHRTKTVAKAVEARVRATKTLENILIVIINVKDSGIKRK